MYVLCFMKNILKNCGGHNFSLRTTCFRCNTPKGVDVYASQQALMPVPKMAMPYVGPTPFTGQWFSLHQNFYCFFSFSFFKGIVKDVKL